MEQALTQIAVKYCLMILLVLKRSGGQLFFAREAEIMAIVYDLDKD